MNSVVMPIRPRGIEREEVDVRSCRRGDGVLDGADDVGRRVDAVDLAHRHLEALAEQQHGLAAAADAGEKLAEIAQRVEHRERTLLALEIAARLMGAPVSVMPALGSTSFSCRSSRVNSW